MADSRVQVNDSCDSIEHAPQYQPNALNRNYETKLHQHDNRPLYWE